MVYPEVAAESGKEDLKKAFTVFTHTHTCGYTPESKATLKWHQIAETHKKMLHQRLLASVCWLQVASTSSVNFRMVRSDGRVIVYPAFLHFSAWLTLFPSGPLDGLERMEQLIMMCLQVCTR